MNGSRSGAAARRAEPVAFRAMPRRSVVVGGFDLQASYIRVEGFEITAEKPAVAVQLGGSHCEVLDNDIHEMMVGVAGTVGRPSADGNTRDYSAVAHNRVAYNRVYHSQYGFMLGGEDWVVENNEVNRLFMYTPGNKYDDCDYSRFFRQGLRGAVQLLPRQHRLGDYGPPTLTAYRRSRLTGRSRRTWCSSTIPASTSTRCAWWRARRTSAACGAGRSGATSCRPIPRR